MSAVAELVIEPHEGPQEDFHASPADIVIYGGAAGGGKTRGILVEPLRHIDNPGFRAVIFRRTSPQIEQPGGMWDESSELYTLLGAQPRLKTHAWRFPSGAVVRFGHIQHEKDMYDWKGAQVALLEFDQLEEFTGRQFFYMLSRLRSLAGVRPYVRATANPVPDDDPVGGWLAEFISWWWDPETGYPILERAGVLRWFVRIGDEIEWGDTRDQLVDRRPNSRPKSVTFIPAKLSDNPTLMEMDPDYRANLEAQSLVERERLLGGNWKIRATAGTVFDEDWFNLVRTPASTAVRVRYWDKAGTQDGGKYTAGLLMARTPEGRYVIEDVVRGQWRASKRESVIKQTARLDGPDVIMWIEQEPGSGGKESAEATIANNPGYLVYADRVTGDKVTRAEPLSAQAEGGNVDVVEADWTKGFLRRMHAFPDGKFLDETDAAAGAFNKLAELDLATEEVFDMDEVGGFVL